MKTVFSVLFLVYIYRLSLTLQHTKFLHLVNIKTGNVRIANSEARPCNQYCSGKAIGVCIL
jgi:hypothetical protein